MATHSNILVWKIPWTEEPGGLQSVGLLQPEAKRVEVNLDYISFMLINCVPLQYSAFLHAFLAPKELAAVDALGGPGTPAVPLGAQWVAGQALAHCSEEEGVRGDSYGRFQVSGRRGRRWGGGRD